MAYVRAVTVALVLAVLLQSGQAAFQLSIPNFFGGSYTLETTAANNNVGGSVGFDGNAIVKKLELGPLGGIQTRLVSPLIPNISNMIAEFQTNLQKTSENVANMFKDPFALFRDPIGTITKNIDQQLKNFGFKPPPADGTNQVNWNNILTQIMNDIDTGRFDVMSLINNAGGLLNEAIKQGAIAWDKAVSVVSAIVSSAVRQAENPISTLIDLLEKAVRGTILMQADAIQLLARAAQAGLHQTLENSNVALDNFLQASAEADVITEETATALRNLLNPQVGTKVNVKTPTLNFNTPISSESAALVSTNFPRIDAVAKSAMSAFN